MWMIADSRSSVSPSLPCSYDCSMSLNSCLSYNLPFFPKPNDFSPSPVQVKFFFQPYYSFLFCFSLFFLKYCSESYYLLLVICSRQILPSFFHPLSSFHSLSPFQLIFVYRTPIHIFSHVSSHTPLFSASPIPVPVRREGPYQDLFTFLLLGTQAF